MATKKKMLQAAAGQAGGAALDITDVFSTYLYTGNAAAQTITNDIDLAGEGGLVWIKNRENISGPHYLHDSEMSSDIQYLSSNSNTGLQSGSAITKNSNGFSIASTSWEGLNASGEDFASWTFRKAPKFFDVVTYTGDGTTGRQIAHNLGTTVGMLVVKSTSHATSWKVQHRSTGATNALELNDTRDASDVSTAFWNDTAASSTHFTVGTDSGVNTSGRTYVAYLFAHNDGDGEFGPDGDQDIIKCGSFTDSGSSSTPTDVNLGFEPQWLLVKASSTSSDWYLLDMMREMSWNDGRHLRPNLSNAETNFSVGYFKPTPTGFQFRGDFFGSGQAAIYMAIRRGPLAPPESATEVFGIDSNTGQTGMQTGVLNDMGIAGSISSTDKWYIGSRLTQGKYLQTNTTAAEPSGASTIWNFDSMDSFFNSITWNGYIGYGWKRAPGFFDVVAYTGNVTLDNVPHNLGAIPEMVWTKCRGNTYDWGVYHKDIGVGSASGADGTGLILNTNIGLNAGADSPLKVLPTSEVFQPFGSQDQSFPYIAYLFATLPGVSKVGSYTGNGSSQTIDCGFTSGARFVLIKRTDSTGDWYVWDTERGIVAGNDPYLELNTTDAEVTSTDWVDPDNSGFIVNGTTINASSAEYIFYAVS